MTNYNQEKREAIKLITKLVETGTLTIEEIGYHVINATGFGELFVTKYINLSVLMGQFKKDKKTGIIRLPDKKEAKA